MFIKRKRRFLTTKAGQMGRSKALIKTAWDSAMKLGKAVG